MENLERVHYNYAFITTIIIALALYFWAPSQPMQILILFAFAGFVGIPHGLTDFKILKKISAMLRVPEGAALGVVVGAAIYIFAGALFLLFWFMAPIAALMLFLGLSVWHFGSQDIGSHNIKGPLKNMHIIARGTSIICVPYLAHPETAAYFNLLVSEEYFYPVMFGGQFIIMAIGISLYVIISLLTRNIRYIFETCLLVFLFIALPPLMSFTLYFCLFHTPRHYIDTIEGGKKVLVSVMLCGVILGTAIFTGLLLIADALIFLDVEYITYFFKLLAALTFSHVCFNFAAQTKL